MPGLPGASRTYELELRHECAAALTASRRIVLVEGCSSANVTRSVPRHISRGCRNAGDAPISASTADLRSSDTASVVPAGMSAASGPIASATAVGDTSSAVTAHLSSRLHCRLARRACLSCLVTTGWFNCLLWGAGPEYLDRVGTA